MFLAGVAGSNVLVGQPVRLFLADFVWFAYLAVPFNLIPLVGASRISRSATPRSAVRAGSAASK